MDIDAVRDELDRRIVAATPEMRERIVATYNRRLLEIGGPTLRIDWDDIAYITAYLARGERLSP